MKYDLVGRKEAAQMLGISTQRLAKLIEAYGDFPEPAAQLAAGTIWDRADIAAWAEQHGRKLPSGRLIDLLGEE